jgi:hypothetical protein
VSDIVERLESYRDDEVVLHESAAVRCDGYVGYFSTQEEADAFIEAVRATVPEGADPGPPTMDYIEKPGKP